VLLPRIRGLPADTGENDGSLCCVTERCAEREAKEMLSAGCEQMGAVLVRVLKPAWEKISFLRLA